MRNALCFCVKIVFFPKLSLISLKNCFRVCINFEKHLFLVFKVLNSIFVLLSVTPFLILNIFTSQLHIVGSTKWRLNTTFTFRIESIHAFLIQFINIVFAFLKNNAGSYKDNVQNYISFIHHLEIEETSCHTSILPIPAPVFTPPHFNSSDKISTIMDCAPIRSNLHFYQVASVSVQW